MAAETTRDLADAFSNLNGAAEESELEIEIGEGAGATKGKESGEPVVREGRALIAKELEADPSKADRMNIYRGNLQVVKTLGTETIMGFITNKQEKTKTVDGVEKHNTTQVPAVVGALVLNCGDVPLEVYQTKSVADEKGFCTRQQELVTLAPEDSIQMTYEDITKTTMAIEYGLQGLNFAVTIKENVFGTGKLSVADAMAKAYITLKGDNGEKPSVHDDRRKVLMTEKDADGTPRVKAEYVEVFGYLNNKYLDKGNVAAGFKKDGTLSKRGGKTVKDSTGRVKRTKVADKRAAMAALLRAAEEGQVASNAQ